MSKNSIYTFDYFQPEEYRFSLDSVFLAQIVAKHLKNFSGISSKHFLDLCSGSGVIGLELSIHCEEIEYLDFLEVQNVYENFFNKNLDGIHADKKKNFHLLIQNYETLLEEKNQNKYDFILSNPPYFFLGEGLLSPNEFKNRCRFFMDSTFEKLLQAIINSLKVNGEAFVLVRPGVHHGRDLFQEMNSYLKTLGHFCEIFDEVRGTNVIRIIKKC